MKFKNSIIFKTGIAAIDQGLLSLINFGVQILLIKSVSKNEYGYFSIAMTIIMYLMSFQNALINTPMVVSIAGKDENNKSNYVSALFSGQFGVLGLLSIIGLLISISNFFLFKNNDFIRVGSAIFIGAFGILNREFLRAYFFAEEKPSFVLKVDFYYVLTYIFLIGSVYLLWVVNSSLIIILMGVAAGFDSLILNKNFKFNFNIRYIKNYFIENWQISKWSIIGVTVTHLQGASYVYVIGILLNSEALAEVSASRILLMPLGLAINGWGNVIRPYGSKLRERNELGIFFNKLAYAGFLFPILLIIMVLILNYYSDLIMKYLFTRNYDSVFQYLIYWAILSFVGFLRSNASYGLQVVKKFQTLAIVNIWTMILTLTLSYVLTIKFGVSGAIIANIIGESIFALILWKKLYKYVYVKV